MKFFHSGIYNLNSQDTSSATAFIPRDYSNFISKKMKYQSPLETVCNHVVRQPQSPDVNISQMFIENYAGSRVLSLRYSHIQNPITMDLLKSIRKLLPQFINNNAVGIVFFASESKECFSKGYHNNGKYPIRLLKESHQLTLDIATIGSSIDLAPIAVYGGIVETSAYGVFATSKYLLGTPTISLRMSDLLVDKTVPYGGFAYHCVSSHEYGLSVARYLALTGRSIGVDALFEFKLISHVVEHRPYIALADTLAHTVPKSFESKIQQNKVVDMKQLKTILDSMCCSSSLDFKKDKLLDEMFLFPISSYVPKEDDQMYIENDDEYLLYDMMSIDYCLTPENDDIQEAIRRLEKFALKTENVWASQLLDGFKNIDHQLIQVSFSYCVLIVYILYVVNFRSGSV